MKASFYQFCLKDTATPVPGDALTGLNSLEIATAQRLKAYFEQEQCSLMRQLSILSRIKAAELSETSKLIPDPEKPSMHNMALSEALVKSNWLGKRQLEPQEVFKYLIRVFEKDAVIPQFEHNMDCVVMIGRREMLDGNEALIERPLSKSYMPVSDHLNYGEATPVDLECGIDPRFPFIDQKTTQRQLKSESGEDQPVFFGTGFFVRKNIIATAGHVVKSMQEAKNKDPKASFIVVLRHRLGLPEASVKWFEIEPESVETLHGEAVSVQDWAYLKVNGESNAFVELAAADTATCGKEVYGLGHGLGLPLKMAWNGMLFFKDTDVFQCKLETFGGNSGSPIFCADTHRVIGILSGNDGATYDVTGMSGANCYVLPKVYLFGNNGAICTSVRPLIERLQVDKL